MNKYQCHIHGYRQEHGTVGAVAINAKGEISAATATGGITGKLPGRIGDTPVIGGGTYADDAVYGASATGLGEAIMKTNVTARVAHLISTGSGVYCCFEVAIPHNFSFVLYHSFVFRNGTEESHGASSGAHDVEVSRS